MDVKIFALIIILIFGIYFGFSAINKFTTQYTSSYNKRKFINKCIAIDDLDRDSLKDSNNLTYLDTYETQDFYKQNPWVYPIPQTYTTALYATRRKNSSL